MADDDGVMFSLAAAKKLVEAAKRELARSQNQRDDRSPRSPFTGVQWFSFINTTEETIPAGAIMEVDHNIVIVEDGRLQVIYQAGKPSTTFRERYAVNSLSPVEAGDGGLCCFEGPAFIAYDSGTPARREGWGPKPGQWALSKGFPSTTLVDGIVDSTNKLLLGTLAPITRCLVKTTGSVTASSATTSYRIYSGTLGSESDAGFTTVPSALSRTAIASGKWGFILHMNNGWELQPLEC